MRRIISISLLLIVFIAHVGYYFIYSYQQYKVRQTVKRQLLNAMPDSFFQVIVAHQNASFSWEEEGREFYQDGQMYDVVKSVEQNGKLLLYCINDKKEDELLRNMGNAANSGSSNMAKQILKVQLTDIPQEVVCRLINYQPHIVHTYYNYDSPLSASDKEVKGPPPRG